MKKNWIAYSLGLFIVMTQAAFAVDSTTVVAPTNLTPSAATSYQLYQGQILAEPDVGDIRTKSIDVRLLAGTWCPQGFSTCLTILPINSNNMNADECRWSQLFSQGTIAKSKDPNANYTISYKFGYIEHGGTGNPCDDRGGFLTFVIDCIPTNSLDSSLLTSKVCM